jgi:hypothetical protein
LWTALLPELAGNEIAFTVQGRLSEAGKPAGGLYDFHFALKHAPEAEALAEWLEPVVPVRDGLFTVPVAFRPACFDVFVAGAEDPFEEACYLEVSVRPASPAGETARSRSPASAAAWPTSPMARQRPWLAATTTWRDCPTPPWAVAAPTKRSAAAWGTRPTA